MLSLVLLRSAVSPESGSELDLWRVTEEMNRYRSGFGIDLALAFTAQDFAPEPSLPFDSQVRCRLARQLYQELGFSSPLKEEVPFSAAIADFEFFKTPVALPDFHLES